LNTVQSSPAALYPKLRPGAPKPAQESVASNQRARLYGAMIEMLATRGYEASIVVESCALAGVSKRTLYERFPGGKQECSLATCDIVVRARLLDGRAAELELLASELLPETKPFPCHRTRSRLRRTSRRTRARVTLTMSARRGIGNHE
jgi:AcrR family transcriptional regulator